MSDQTPPADDTGIELDAEGIPILKEVVRPPAGREGIEEELRRELQVMIGIAAVRVSAVVAKQVERELRVELERFLEQRLLEVVGQVLERREEG